MWAKHDSILLTIFYRPSLSVGGKKLQFELTRLLLPPPVAFRTLLLLLDAIYQCAMPTHFLRPPQIPGNGVLGPSDFNASPQAVFTSFKLPKPGGGQPGQATPPAVAAPPAPLPTPSSAAELLAMAAAGPDFKFSLAGGGSSGGSGGVTCQEQHRQRPQGIGNNKQHSCAPNRRGCRCNH